MPRGQNSRTFSALLFAGRRWTPAARLGRAQQGAQQTAALSQPWGNPGGGKGLGRSLELMRLWPASRRVCIKSLQQRPGRAGGSENRLQPPSPALNRTLKVSGTANPSAGFRKGQPSHDSEGERWPPQVAATAELLRFRKATPAPAGDAPFCTCKDPVSNPVPAWHSAGPGSGLCPSFHRQSGHRLTARSAHRPGRKSKGGSAQGSPWPGLT